MIEVSGLWLNKDKNGNQYMSGSCGKVKYLVMKNTFKTEGSNEPDYRLLVAENTKEEDK